MALPAQTRALRLAIVAVALFGILLVTHLALQKSVNDFAFGCSGVAGEMTDDASGCADVTSSQWASLFGIPQTTLGLLFYVLMAVLRLGYVVQRDDRLRLAALGLAGFGVAYSAWLVIVQATQIGSFCALCLGSALTTLVLLVLHVIEHRRLRGVADAPVRTSRPEPTGLAALRPYAPLLGLFVILLGADVVLARAGADRAGESAEGASPASLSASATGTAAGEQTPGAATAEPAPYDPAACLYDPNMAPISDTSPFTSGPFKGTEGAPVEIIEIFDPNCPHCKELMAVLDPVVEANLSRIRFYPVAYPLRQQSLGQVVALTLAQREGKFFELIDEMMDRQDATWGMALPELQAAVEAVGMSGTGLAATMQDQMRLQPLLDAVQAQTTAVGAAFAAPDGGISVPKLAINGRVVASSYASYSADCLQQFIDDAAGE